MSDTISFTDFLNNSRPLEDPVVCFVLSADYPLLFFSRAIAQLKIRYPFPVQMIDSATMQKQQMVGLLETSFLGSQSLYWLRDMSAVSAREQSSWLQYAAQYTGPNHVWFCMQEGKETKKCAVTVTIPAVVDAHVFKALAAFFDIPCSVQRQRFISQLFKERSHVSLDSACLLLEYMQLISTDSKAFFNDTLNALAPSEQSLFALSTAFLAKKSAAFYAQWRVLEHHYSEQFWCSFFSDLLWRGAQYIRSAQEQNMIAARKIAYRLPFSFIKSDWRKLKYSELVAAHAFMYKADYKLKNSAGYAAFDLFFSTFFLSGFASKPSSDGPIHL